MATEFFPNMGFALAFVGVLVAGLCVASYHDLKTLVVPKKVTVGLLAVGVVMNLIRGGWLGAEGKPTWAFSDASAALGALDGFLFALCGFLFGFTLFFVMWLFGVCGGGDVKLAAAVGGWVGPKFLLGVLGLALVAVFILTVARIAVAVSKGKPSSVVAKGAGKKKGKGQPTDKKVLWRLMSYSLPFTIGVIALFLIGFRQQLGFVNP